MGDRSAMNSGGFVGLQDNILRYIASIIWPSHQANVVLIWDKKLYPVNQYRSNTCSAKLLRIHPAQTIRFANIGIVKIIYQDMIKTRSMSSLVQSIHIQMKTAKNERSQ